MCRTYGKPFSVPSVAAGLAIPWMKQWIGVGNKSKLLRGYMADVLE